MNISYINLSGDLDPVWEVIFKLLTEQEIPFFVIGALARDLIFTFGHQKPVTRATLDIDVAVKFTNWADYDDLRGRLLDSGFVGTTTTHRLIYADVTPLDLVPFGTIETEESTINWPSNDGMDLNVMGFEDAFNAAQKVVFPSGFHLDVASPAGLACLKILAWQDRKPDNTKDALDLAYVIDHYFDLNADMLGSDGDLLETDEFEHDMVSARLLGRNMSRILSPPARESIKQILKREVDSTNQKQQLVTHMTGRIDLDGTKFSRWEKCIASLHEGFNESN